MKNSEIREMSDEQLSETLKDSCESLFRLRIQAQTERLDAPSELRRNKRLIARIKTLQKMEKKEKLEQLRSRRLTGRSARLLLLARGCGVVATVAHVWVRRLWPPNSLVATNGPNVKVPQKPLHRHIDVRQSSWNITGPALPGSTL
mgnify:CR=1 FL=1